MVSAVALSPPRSTGQRSGRSRSLSICRTTAPLTMSWCVSASALPEGDVAMMLELARWSVSELPLFVLTGIATHLVVSGSQTLFHYSLGHHRLGGVFFRNHIRFHHSYYARGH